MDSPVAILYDVNGIPIVASTTAPVGTELAVVVRNIPSGVQDTKDSATDATGAAVPADAIQIAGEDPGGNLVALSVDATGALNVNVSPGSGTTAVTSVANSVASVTLLAANVNRLGATITNDSNTNLFVKLGATASATSFTAKLTAQSYYEVPFSYTGVIDAIASVAVGNARITEFS
jgi:hypothetical protein